MSNKLLPVVLAVSVVSGCAGVQNTNEPTGAANSPNATLTLAYSDGRVATTGVDDVNAVLRSVGVRVSALPLPDAASALLDISKTRALTSEEASQLISVFSMDRGDLLQEIERAGRKPATPNGGALSTREEGVPPYPKVYDMKALSPSVMRQLQVKFGKLHVNSADSGEGIDEVMSIVSGGPWTWFFVLADGVIGKLTLGHVGLDGPGWRISYPGLGPHGGFLDPEYGLVVAYAHGPETFVMRYVEPSVRGAELLGSNDWIDLSGEAPKLLDRVR